MSVLLILALLCPMYACQPGVSATDKGKSDIEPPWSSWELAVLESLWLENLPPLPADPSNAVADDPRAAAFGRELFFDKRLSANGEVACATCHKPELAFTDGLARARGIGDTKRNTPSIIGTAYSPWYFWDGRSDSQWFQALGPLEDAKEHGGNRMQYAHLLFEDAGYRQDYESLFGEMPLLSDRERFPRHAGPVDDDDAYDAWDAMSESDRDIVTRIFTNIGKAIAAYERTVLPGTARFDRYVQALQAGDLSRAGKMMTADEVAGLKLFIGKAECVACHFGPLFSSHDFQNIATEFAPGLAKDYGRFKAMNHLLSSEFNCLGRYSDAQEDDCQELKFVRTSGADLMGAFKVPTLRNVAETAPYMHAGQMADLESVIKHYMRAPKSSFGATHLKSFDLDEQEQAQLKAFLHTLSDTDEVPGLLTDNR